jgi:ribosomal protein S18 acetylase RimI-like enzyme
MNTNYKIRNAEPEDVLALHDVYLTTWLDTYPNQEFNITREDIIFKYENNKTSEKIEERKQKMAQRGSNEIMLVVEADKKIIALCNASQKEENNQLQAIYVLPDYQRLGLGRALWEEAKKIFDFKKDTIVRVASYNEKAINFYKKSGFQSTGKIIIDEKFKMRNGAIIPELEMIINKKTKLN